MLTNQTEKKDVSCETCVEWDNGLCDLTGYFKSEDDVCRKWQDGNGKRIGRDEK